MLSRRSLLQSAIGVAASSSLAGCSGSDDAEGAAPLAPADPRTAVVFAHGVASGDPLVDAVILWTRVSVDGGQTTVDVTWEMATDPSFASIAAKGGASTDATRDFTVKVDASGLSPATTYYYRFRALGTVSPIGRTRTAPTGQVDRLRFGMTSCSSLAHGYFHGYRALASQPDLDAVLHLGDYIYEYPTGEYGDARPYEPDHEIVSLADYRARYSQYRRDPDLAAIHRQHPFITIWDDHETADNAWKAGANNHTEGAEGAFADRRAAATQAYGEWMPIREPAAGRVFRTLRYGSLVDLILLDTRLWGRELQAAKAADAVVSDPQRSLLGADQEAWFAGELAESKATWRLVGQQVVMGQLPNFFNGDAWDGYPAARARFFDAIVKKKATNVIVLTGDIHSSWAIDLAPDPTKYDPATGAGAIAVELVTPGITSPGVNLESVAMAGASVALENRHVRWVDLFHRGFVVLDVTAERVQAAYHHYAEPEKTDVTPAFAKAFGVRAGTPHAVEEPAAAPPRANPPALAP